MLNIQERQNGATTILDLEGDVIMGGGSAALRDKIADLVRNEKANVLLNFEKVKYMDSSGTGEIVAGMQILEKNGGSLKLVNLTQKVEQVLTLSSILPILDIYDDEASALDS